MTPLLRYVDPQGRVHWIPSPHQTGPEMKADLEREWARQREAEAAQAEAAKRAEDTRLEIAAVELYQQLGKAIGGITDQQSWVDLDTEVTALVEAKGLSSRHGRELHDRLLRVAKDRRWIGG